MNTTQPFNSRVLKFRKHFQVYFIFLILLDFLISALWVVRFSMYGVDKSLVLYQYEFVLSLIFIFGSPFLYTFWLSPRINKRVELFNDHLMIRNDHHSLQIKFSDISQVKLYFASLFSVKLKNGKLYFFNSDLERLDYLWEALHAARPDLINNELFSSFQITLVKADHHQKRKEWFLKHRAIDIFCWIVLPLGFMYISYYVQSKEVVIYQLGIYFFRLFMYSLITMLVISLSYTFLLKKLIFDKKFDSYLKDHHVLEKNEKVRDLDYENLIIKKSKIFQAVIASFLFAFIIKSDLNFFSVAKSKVNLSSFNIPKGKAILVDNRFNCFDCKYNLSEGDVVIFGSGTFGQVMAKAGEAVGEVVQDTKGRTIASVSLNEVPENHLAIKSANGKDVIFVKLEDIIGRLEK